MLADLARDLRDARIAAGLSQQAVARAAGIARSTLSLIERNLAPDLTLLHAAAVASVLGLELSVRLYRVGPALRDAGHIRLLNRFRALVGERLRWHYERGVSLSGDLRAFDVVLRVGVFRIAVEVETRIHDLQALLRRIEAKRRDSNVDRVVLVIADTRHNREVLKLAEDALGRGFPCSRRTLLAALHAGADPGADGYLLV